MFANYIALEEGIPLRLHFTDDYLVDRDITDPQIHKVKRVKTLVFWVDEVNGEPASKSFSILSQALLAKMQPYLAGKNYVGWTFVITKIGSGFTASFQVKAIPRP